MIKKFDIATQNRYQLIDITVNVYKTVEESGIKNGLVFIFTPHSTAAILITENESGLNRDWLEFFKKQVSGLNFIHDPFENNADSHILAGLIGHEKTFMIDNCKIIIGKWQQVFLAEFDGPKVRKIMIKVIKD